MISIVICSRKENISEELVHSIENTIGNVEYEIIVVDNSTNKYNIFTAYNYGQQKAKYQYVCFMHDDILFLSENWGLEIIEMLKEEDVGMLGVMGTTYIPPYPTGWWTSGEYRGRVIELINGQKEKQNYPVGYNEIITAVDGLWFTIRKSLFEKISFDDKLYSGFHCYDFDISMQVMREGYKIKIMPKLLLLHKSRGQVDIPFYKEYAKFTKKWRRFLPCPANIDDKDAERFYIDNVDRIYRAFVAEFILNKITKTMFYRFFMRMNRKLFEQLYS